MDVTTIDVAGDQSYQVLVGPDLLDRLPALLPGAAQVAVVHAAPLLDLADRIGTALRASGLTVRPIELPDAESANSLEVAGACWDALGGAAFTRSDAGVR